MLSKYTIHVYVKDNRITSYSDEELDKLTLRLLKIIEEYNCTGYGAIIDNHRGKVVHRCRVNQRRRVAC